MYAWRAYRVTPNLCLLDNSVVEAPESKLQALETVRIKDFSALGLKSSRQDLPQPVQPWVGSLVCHYSKSEKDDVPLGGWATPFQRQPLRFWKTRGFSKNTQAWKQCIDYFINSFFLHYGKHSCIYRLVFVFVLLVFFFLSTHNLGK